jgi:hypothetical protein
MNLLAILNNVAREVRIEAFYGHRALAAQGRPSNCLSAQARVLLGPCSERLHNLKVTRGRKKILSTIKPYYSATFQYKEKLDARHQQYLERGIILCII